MEHHRPRLAGIRFAPLGVALIAGTYLGISGSDPFPGWRAMLPTVGAALIILSRPDAPFSRRVMASRAAVAIGLISYPLYLWHWLVLSYSRILFDHLAAPALAGLLVISMIFAWATYRFVETGKAIPETLQYGRGGTGNPSARTGSHCPQGT